MKRGSINWKSFKNGDFPKNNKFCWVICENELLPRLGYYRTEQAAATLENFWIREWAQDLGAPKYWASYEFPLPSDKANEFLHQSIKEILLHERFKKCVDK